MREKVIWWLIGKLERLQRKLRARVVELPTPGKPNHRVIVDIRPDAYAVLQREAALSDSNISTAVNVATGFYGTCILGADERRPFLTGTATFRMADGRCYRITVQRA